MSIPSSAIAPSDINDGLAVKHQYLSLDVSDIADDAAEAKLTL